MKRKKRQRILSLLLSLCLLCCAFPVSALAAGAGAQAAAPEGQTPFADVPAGAWYVPAVRYVYEQALFSGSSPTTFSPESPMKRAELVQVLANKTDGYSKALYEGATCFADVELSYWGCAAIRWAYRNNLADGTGPAEFSPESRITREQIAVFLYRYAQRTGGDTNSAGGSFAGFSDAGKISGWARTAMQWAVKNGILNGSGGRLRPGDNATRAEVAQMFLNAKEALQSNALLPQEEREDPDLSLPLLLKKVDSELVLRALGSLSPIGSLSTEDIGADSWYTLCSAWLARAYHNAQNPSLAFPTPVSAADFLGENRPADKVFWDAYFSRDCLDLPIELFSGSPEAVFNAVSAYCEDEAAGLAHSFPIHAGETRLVYRMAGRGYPTVTLPVLLEKKLEGDSIVLRYSFSVLPFASDTYDRYEGKAVLTAAENSLGYRIETIADARV